VADLIFLHFQPPFLRTTYQISTPLTPKLMDGCTTYVKYTLILFWS